MSRLGVGYGAVMFDDPRSPREGWAFAFDANESYRIRGMGDLRTDTLWWTNIEYNYFYGKTNAWRNTWLRHDKYLPVAPKRALQEWGWEPTELDEAWKAKIIAAIFRRCMLIAEDLLVPVFSGNPHFDDVFAAKTLREDLRPLLPKLDYPTGRARECLQDGRAFQQFTRTRRNIPKSDRRVLLQTPRLEYARYMLSHPVPAGSFEAWRRDDLAPDGEDALGKVLQMNQPVLAEVTIKEIDQVVAPVFAFGSGLDRNQKTTRHWVAYPELVMMTEIARFDVGNVFVGQEHVRLIDQLPDHVRAFLNDQWVQISWSAGLVAEALWRAALLPEPKTKNKEDPARTSWQGLWLRAYDRNRLFMDARTLDREDFPAIMYGYGWMSVSTPEEGLDELIQKALMLGYVPQMQDVKPSMWSEPGVPSIEDLWGGHKNSKWFAAMAVQGMRNRLWHVDTLPLLPEDKRKREISKILRGGAKKGRSSVDQ